MRSLDRAVQLLLVAGVVTIVYLGSCPAEAAGDRAAPVLVLLLEENPSILSVPLQAQFSPLAPAPVAGGYAKVAAVSFFSHSHKEKPVRIFGYYALPPHEAGEKVPGLVLIHGGGGRAVLSRALRGAANGFASLAIDLPGRGDRRAESRSTGLDMTVTNLFRTSPELSDNYLYHAVLAALRSVEFLRQRAEVDPDRVALYGISWGGATSLIAGSLDARLAGVVNLFGSGYLPGRCTWGAYLEGIGPDKVDRWAANFDPAVYVDRMRAPILFVTGTNDGCYYLPRFLRTYETVGSEAHLVLRPNLDHRIDQPGDAMIWTWLRMVVRDGVPQDDLPKFKAVRIDYRDQGDSVAISVAVGGKAEAIGAAVAYANDGYGWTKKRWEVAPARADRPGWLTARIPLSESRTFAFATVRFRGGLRISTPVHTFVKAGIHGERRPYHIPFLADRGVDMPARELAGDLGADPQAVLRRAQELLPDPTATSPVHPLARVVEGRLYVAADDLARLTGTLVTWQRGAPCFTIEAPPAATGAVSAVTPKTSVPTTAIGAGVALASSSATSGAGGP